MTVTAQVPTLETPQGGVFESNAIARYVARIADKGLFGTTTFEAVWSSLAWVPSPIFQKDVLCTYTIIQGRMDVLSMSDMQGQVEQWIDFTTQGIDAPMLSWFLPIIGFMEYNQKVSDCLR